jgi:hypothetical protein
MLLDLSNKQQIKTIQGIEASVFGNNHLEIYKTIATAAAENY